MELDQRQGAAFSRRKYGYGLPDSGSSSFVQYAKVMQRVLGKLLGSHENGIGGEQLNGEL